MDSTGMVEIKSLLGKEISEGYVNWELLSKKIDCTLESIRGEFVGISEKDGKKQTVKIDDALTFRVKRGSHLAVFCYKILCPRMIMGKLYCTGILYGYYDEAGRPVFPRGFMPNE